jgi:glycosyltransferase involved in cell wall biosynthesis
MDKPVIGSQEEQMPKAMQICGNSRYGGCAPLVLKWCDFLLSRNWQVDVLATDPFFVSELKRIQGLRVINSIYLPRDIIPISCAKAFIQLLRLLQREKYDVIHTYTSTPGFLGRIAARLMNVPVILHHQAGGPVNVFSSTFQRFLYTPLEYLAVLASSKSICVSHAVARQQGQFHTTPRRKQITICNGIDPRPFIAAIHDGSGEALRKELNISRDSFVIGNTGRLAPQKDNETLIRAMVPLKSILKDVPFVLILAGEGEEKEKLENLIHSLALGDRVRLLGFWKDIPAFLAALDIFASPSLWEGLSISILEAMAAGKPIVATSILPNAELIENEVTGLLVLPKSPEGIAEAIVRIVREPGLGQRCAAAARRRMMEGYTMDRMFKQTWDLYLDLLREKKPCRHHETIAA